MALADARTRQKEKDESSARLRAQREAEAKRIEEEANSKPTITEVTEEEAQEIIKGTLTRYNFISRPNFNRTYIQNF